MDCKVAVIMHVLSTNQHVIKFHDTSEEKEVSQVKRGGPVF